jgi:hypothetical protein
MALHLIKLCVGCDNVDDLRDWIREKLREKKKRGLPLRHVHTTRMMPKRVSELIDGGSLYWVIHGEILCRQRLLEVEAFRDRDGVRRCRLVLDPRLVLTEPRPFRPFQGWRYLPATSVPKDLHRAAPGARHMPEQLRRELRQLGLL